MTKAKLPKIERCEFCGRPLPTKRGGRRRYCNDACQQKAYRQRKNQRAQG